MENSTLPTSPIKITSLTDSRKLSDLFRHAETLKPSKSGVDSGSDYINRNQIIKDKDRNQIIKDKDRNHINRNQISSKDKDRESRYLAFVSALNLEVLIPCSYQTDQNTQFRAQAYCPSSKKIWYTRDPYTGESWRECLPAELSVIRSILNQNLGLEIKPGRKLYRNRVVLALMGIDLTKDINPRTGKLERRVVHHKDHNTLNDVPSNLQAMFDSDHSVLHFEENGEHLELFDCNTPTVPINLLWQLIPDFPKEESGFQAAMDNLIASLPDPRPGEHKIQLLIRYLCQGLPPPEQVSVIHQCHFRPD